MLAERALGAESSDARRLNFIYQRLLARNPDRAEAKVLLNGLTLHRTRFNAAPAAATELLAIGETPANPKLSAPEHAAWTALCLAVLNLDETLNKP